MKTIKRAVRILAAVAVVSAGLAARANATTIVSLSPSTATPASGSPFTVDIVYTRDLTDLEIGGVTLDLIFSGQISPDLTFGTGGNFFGYTPDPDNSMDYVDPLGVLSSGIDFSNGFVGNILHLDFLGGLNIGSPQALSFTIARVGFNALVSGPGTLALDGIEFSNLDGTVSFNPTRFDGAQVCVNGDCSTGANPVPEPTTMVLFATGLAALVARRRKQNRSQL